MTQENHYLTVSFVAPSGYQYTIREENGEDEEILSNQSDMNGGMNIVKFLAAIIVSTDFTESGKVTVEDVMDIPSLDRNCILFKSRIFSLGPTVSFYHDWTNGRGEPTMYEQDLNEMIYSDYSNEEDITEEEKQSKKDALPFYPDREIARAIKFKDYELTLSSGKQIKFDFMTSRIEQKILAQEKQTRNTQLICRNLCLAVNGKWEPVQRFHLFSVRDMAEIHKAIQEIDPVWNAFTDIEDPITGEVTKYPIVMAPRFFFLTEA